MKMHETKEIKDPLRPMDTSPLAKGEEGGGEEQKNTEVLNQSGINIIIKKEEDKPEIQTEKRDEMLDGVENPESILPKTPAPSTASILEQKLNNSFKIPTIETTHTNDFLKKPTIGGVKTDPYRESVE